MANQPFRDAESERFRSLLLMAAVSPFEGERANAVAAAERMAARHGMTLEEAAAGGGPVPSAPVVPRSQDEAELAAFVHLMDYQISVAKARREAALHAAKSRGLDDSPRPLRRLARAFGFRRRRVDPVRHASTLLAETAMTFREISGITGLDIYQVVGLKLKMRPP